MPVPRATLALRASKSLKSNSAATKTRATGTLLTFSTSQKRAADHAHEDHYDPPSGWLFGVKPGEKAEKEGWETVWVWGFFGSIGLAAVGYAFKPDTS